MSLGKTCYFLLLPIGGHKYGTEKLMDFNHCCDEAVWLRESKK